MTTDPLQNDDRDDTMTLAGQRVAFVGKLGGVTRKEANQTVREQGGTPVDHPDPKVHLIVIGADQLPLADPDELFEEEIRDAAAKGTLEIISETQFWQRLGLVENERNIHQLYTPAMLADLLGVSVSIIRRWHRRKLIIPVREVRKLPYFDFQEVSTARHLAQLLASGASPKTIERKLERLARYVPEVKRPLTQLSVIIEGKQILLRQGEGLIEPGGQLRFDFASLDNEQTDATDQATQQKKTDQTKETADTDTLPSGTNGHAARHIVSLEAHRAAAVPTTPDSLCRAAENLEEAGELELAAETYRAALAAGGPDAAISFLLAELLYRMGDLAAARERYYAAIELNEDFVEARANLGCVLAETGQQDLAVAAFQGALKYHSDYPDAHYHLARSLDELGRATEAIKHWQIFLKLSPNSPWAEEAQTRLEG